MQFSPELRATTTLTVSSSSLPTLYFTCKDPPAAPELWTNVPTATEADWHAVAFAETQPGLWVASLPLAQLGADTHAFEYTYRLKRSDGGLDWLGQDGGNGQVVLKVQAQDGGGNEQEVKARLVEFDLQGDSEDGSELFPLDDLDEVREFAGASHGFVLEQSTRPWFVPRLLPAPTPLADLSPDFLGQLLVLRSTTSPRTLVILPFTSPTVVSTFVGSHSTKGLNLHCTRDSTCPVAKGSVVVGVAQNGQLRAFIDQCVQVAREALGASFQSPNLSEPENSPLGLTWCTWNALGPNYSLSKVLDSLEKLGLDPAASATPLFPRAIDAVLLDDGWQDVKPFDDPFEPGRERRGLWSFGANGSWADVVDSEGEGEAAETTATVEGRRRRRQDSGFHVEADMERDLEESREELKDAVRRIKALGIENVGVWMTLAGYWDSIHPAGPLAASFPMHCLSLKSDAHPDADTAWYLPGPSSLPEYYHAYFSFLHSAGISFIKVDDQAHLDFIATSPSSKVDLGALRTSMLLSMQAAARDVFGSERVIHCMAGSPRIWGGALALTGKSTSIVRNSDDYFPDRQDAHRWHIFLNSYSTLLTRSIAFRPDFDMCEENHPWGPFHIAFRAFAPAPTFSTDAPSDFGIVVSNGWKMLLAPSALGGVRVLKTQNETGAVLEGRIGEDVTGGSVGPAIKIGMAVAGAEGALFGLWNCRADENSTSDVLDARDVADALTSGAGDAARSDVVVYFGALGKVYEVSRTELVEAEGADRILAMPFATVALGPREAQVAAIAPFFALPSSTPPVESFTPLKIACVGLLDKYAGLAAIDSIAVVDRTAPLPLALTPPASTSSTLSRKSSTQTLRDSMGNRYSRISFIFAFLVGYRPRDRDDSRTYITEASSLAHDFVRRPIKTVFHEVSAFFGVLTAAVVWTISSAATRRPAPSIAPPTVQSPQVPIADAASAAVESQAKGDKVLRVQLAFAGRVGFYASGTGVVPLTFALGGKPVGAEFVERLELGIIAVDVEGFLGGEVEQGAKGGSGWVLDVAC